MMEFRNVSQHVIVGTLLEIMNKRTVTGFKPEAGFRKRIKIVVNGRLL